MRLTLVLALLYKSILPPKYSQTIVYDMLYLMYDNVIL